MKQAIGIRAGMAAVALGAAAAAAAEGTASNTPWAVSIVLGVNANSGNTDAKLYNARVDAAKAWGPEELRLGAEGVYGDTAGAASADAQKAAANYKHRWDGLYGYLDGSVLRDAIADVRYRAVAGLGAGSYLIQTPDHKLSLEAGGAFLAEKLGSQTNETVVVRAAERYDWTLSPGARVWQTAEYLPHADDFGAFLLNAEVGLEAVLTSRLSFQWVAQDQYNSRPSEGRKKNDVAVKASLVCKL